MIPLLGVAMLAGVYAAGKLYLQYEGMARSNEQLKATVNRLQDYYTLNRILMQLQSGDSARATLSLDRALSTDILALNAEFPSADSRTQALISEVFQRMARVRMEYASSAAASGVDPAGPEMAAHTILVQAQPGKFLSQ